MKFLKSIQTSDLKLFGSIKDAQSWELRLVIDKVCDSVIAGDGSAPLVCGQIRASLADALVLDAQRIIDILTTKETSRPGARRINGATRKKKDKPSPAVQAEKAAQEQQSTLN